MKTKRLILTIMLIAGLLLIIYSISKQTITEKKIAAEGLYAPNIELIDIVSGKKILSLELKGKVLFINFWATWCNPCREEIPSIHGLFRHFTNNPDFMMLTIPYRDDPQNGIAYLRQNGFNLPLMIDRDSNGAESYGVTGVPETYIVDKKGILREKVIGPYQWDSPEVIEVISKLLSE